MVNDGGSTQGSRRKLNMNDALAYIRTVKEVFSDKKDKYDAFLEVLEKFTDRRLKPDGVALRVAELFKGYPNLISGFNNFLPERYKIAPVKPIFEDAISLVNKIKLRFQGDEHVYKSFLDIMKGCKENYKTLSEVHQEVDMLFQDHPDLIEEFIHFLPDASVEASAGRGEDFVGGDGVVDNGPAEVAGSSDGMYNQVFQFCAKVKERLDSSDKYREFLKCLCRYKRERITKQDLYSLVHDMLGNYPDLLNALDEFLMHCEYNDGFLDTVMSKKSLWPESSGSNSPSE